MTGSTAIRAYKLIMKQASDTLRIYVNAKMGILRPKGLNVSVCSPLAIGYFQNSMSKQWSI